MFGRTPLLIGILVAAAGLPYILSNPNWSPLAKKRLDDVLDRTSADTSRVVSTSSARSEFDLPASSRVGSDPLVASPPAMQGRALSWPLVAGPPTGSLAELVNWEIRPDWVVSNWARLSVVPGPERWRGLRGALVTGTEVHDLCGTITYYFDARSTLQRVVVTGTTGNYQPIWKWASESLGFVGEPSAGMGVFVRRVDDRLEGVLAIQHPPVIRGDRPRDRYRVFLELQRPGIETSMSREALGWLGEDPGSAERPEASPEVS